jgi:predicted enzyme related to lactoylglutathione lyase
MTHLANKLTNRPAWVELTTSDPAAARDFYSNLFGWNVEVSDDPQYGGYAMAHLGEHTTAGIGPKQDPNMPNVWGLYIGADDIDALAAKVAAAGGTVIAPPFDVGDQGRMAVFADPSGAVISGWQRAGTMSDFTMDESGAFGWAELNARNVANVVPFYENVFGWSVRESDMGPDQPPYREFQQDGHSVLGAWEMNDQMPAEVPSYWQIYFDVDDVDAAHAKAKSLGATDMVPPQDFPGGRFAIMNDPHGASFALLKTTPRDS